MREKLLLEYYNKLREHFGDLGWWPASNALEVVLGVVLTQNTTWRNVELALRNIADAGKLEVGALLAIPLDMLEEYIRPAGFYKQKSLTIKRVLFFMQSLVENSSLGVEEIVIQGVVENKLKNFFEFGEYGDLNFDAELSCCGAFSTEELRQGLLSLRGIGKESADSILLYALRRSVFVVDSYTKRIFSRHLFVEDEVSYDELQEFFMDVLHHDPELFMAYHAYIVETAKMYCKKKQPSCNRCPLYEFLEYSVEE